MRKSKTEKPPDGVSPVAAAPAGTQQFFVYVLGSRRGADARTYVGWTTVLERRLRQHNAGRGAKSTRGRQWALLYSECCATREAAMSREWYLKRDRKFRKVLLEQLHLREPDATAR